MASSKETYCLCGQPYNIGQFMIECDCCREWFHGSCVDVKIYQSDDIDKYHCPKCAQTYGPSVLKIPTNNHRADRYELGAESRPAQAGSPAWVRTLAARPLRPVPAALHRMRGQQFTEEFIRDNGFTRPVMFHSTEGLDMTVPPADTFTVRTVLRYCGPQFEVEVIDVRKQATLRMPLGEVVQYLEGAAEARADRVLNVISLEFSDTDMAPLVSPPRTLRQLDWASAVWPEPGRPPRPAVQKYCLMSAAGSYTDWHVDLGGTTVWYHVIYGSKIFYLAPPTATNLALYQQWSQSANQNERFFGDMVEWYGTVSLGAGETLCIPAGWLHAVLTPRDALVLGGNLLHDYAVELQLAVYEIERRVDTPLQYRYPHFERLHWHCGAAMLALLRRHNEETQDEDYTGGESEAPPPAELPPLLLRGIRLLAGALKEWHALKATEPAKRDSVPKSISSGQVVRDLGRELRVIDRRAAARAARDKEPKLKQPSPTKSRRAPRATPPRPARRLKLTLPPPIVHNTPLAADAADAAEAALDGKLYVAKEAVYHDGHYIEETKYATAADAYGREHARAYEPAPRYAPDAFAPPPPGKMDHSPSASREPPPYTLPEHSILKSHLTARDPPRLHHWTISKREPAAPGHDPAGDYHEEQILFTNDQLQPVAAAEVAYGPGMYSAEDMQQEYAGSFPGEYREPYYQMLPAPALAADRQQGAVYAVAAEGAYTHQPPTYDAAVQQHYATAAADYQQQPPPPPAQPTAAAPAARARPVRRSERAVRRRVSPSYQYSDGEDWEPRRPRRAPGGAGYRRPAPANGIESLIQASVLAEEEPPPAHEGEDAAVAGMLSIGSTISSALNTQQVSAQVSAQVSTQVSAQYVRARTFGLAAEDAEEEEEKEHSEVHRDENYVYPSLEMSSDDEEERAAARRRRNSRTKHDRARADKDEAWSPRARLGRLTPRLRGPARHAVRRECVRAALTHARTHHAEPRHAPPPPNAKRAVVAAKNRRPPPAPVETTPNKNNSRLKKGMKTAKQRLGKILKLHKMIY